MAWSGSMKKVASYITPLVERRLSLDESESNKCLEKPVHATLRNLILWLMILF